MSVSPWRAALETGRRWTQPRYVWARAVHNLGPKLLSLLVALTLWFLATSNRRANVEQGFDVPVTIRDTTGGRGEGTRAFSDLNPATIRVTLSGRPDRLRELRPESIEAIVDVTGQPEGSFSQPVTVTAPSGTVVSRRTPDRVQGFVDTQATRTLPIVLSVSSPPETSLPRYQVTPTDASVQGPGRVVTTVQRVVTSPTQVPAGEERETRLIALDGAGTPVDGVVIRPETVTLRRLDTGVLPVKTLSVVLNDPPPTLRVTAASVQPSTVRVVADPELLGRLREVAGRVDYRVGTYTAPVALSVPAGAQALESVIVRLTVEAAPAPTPPARPGGTPPAAP
ncbi:MULTISPECIES: YbbR-like domain-containing protein [Deinococcus]|uniref:YbbR-like domain-containing protein n=1 Tax=Deinococcus rufus TaxID=2136097 RepID=A0ABV7Z3G2_9DEIO|nr:CdaR family protein [Deinococcus sp. AB2017081]WQE96014.1 CdaR family protein [Deinococcus sp. AB2017081]